MDFLWNAGKVFGLIFIILLVLTGCGANGPKAGAEEPELDPPAEEVAIPVELPTPAPEPEPEPIFPFFNPLTGVGSDEEITSRPVVVMIENSSAARPQSGLDQADIVYEILAEGDITRFVAIFQSEKPEVIGPVRSIRPYFVEIGAGFDALIVHAGWSQEAMNMISARRLAHFDQVYGDHAYYWRDNSRKAPHNLYTSIAKIEEGAVKKKFREEWQAVMPKFGELVETIEASATAASSTSSTTSPSTPKADTPIRMIKVDQINNAEPITHKITIEYLRGYKVAYEYDAELAIYKRDMAGKPHLDKESDEQLVATNVLIVESAHRVLDNAGRRAVDVFGPGKGVLIQHGQSLEVEWEHRDGMIRPYVAGVEVPLLPGKTWIQVVPIGSKVNIETDFGSE